MDAVDRRHCEAEPLAAHVRVFAQSWIDSVLADREVLEPSLREVGLCEKEVLEALELRDEAASQARYWDDKIEDFRARTAHLRFFTTPPELEELISQRESVVARLRNWFNRREYIIEAREEYELRVPLFVLAAPAVAGCTATVSMRREEGVDLEWGLTIVGTGLGGAANMSVASSATFGASEGEIKAVFVPAIVPVERVTVLEEGRRIGEGFRIDPAGLAKSPPLELGVMRMPRAAVPAAGRLVNRYLLADDTPGAVATYDYSYANSGSGKLSLGVKALGADLHVSASIAPSHSVSVTYGLAGGSDYELHELAEGCGLIWEDPHRPVEPSASA